MYIHTAAAYQAMSVRVYFQNTVLSELCCKDGDTCVLDMKRNELFCQVVECIIVICLWLEL